MNIDPLPNYLKLYISYLKGDYDPELGTKNFPFDKRFRGKQDLLQIDEEKYFLIYGLPHPIYKNFYYSGNSRGKQFWCEGAKEIKNRRQSPLFTLELLNYGLAFCGFCKNIKKDSDFCACERTSNKRNNMCKECSRTRGQQYRQTENGKKVIQEYNRKNEKKLKEAERQWRLKNKDRIRASKNKSSKKRVSTKTGFMQMKMRNGIRKFFVRSGLKRKNSTREYLESFLGCSLENLAEIYYSQKTESKKEEEYRSETDLDHIIPCSLAIESERRNLFGEDFLYRISKAIWHYSNLQPMDWRENQHKKNDKIDGVRVKKMSDSRLIEICEELVEKTEKIRAEDLIKNPAISDGI